MWLRGERVVDARCITGRGLGRSKHTRVECGTIAAVAQWGTLGPVELCVRDVGHLAMGQGRGTRWQWWAYPVLNSWCGCCGRKTPAGDRH